MVVSTTSDASSGNLRAKLAQVRKIERTSGLAVAERALVDILREGPPSHQGFLALSRVLVKQRKFDDALRAAAKAKSLAPLEADPLIAVGLVNMRLRDRASAATAFAEAIRLDPNSARAHLGAAAVKMADESYDDALALCEKVLDLDPTMERARELVARIQMKQGRTDLALAELKSIVEKNPENQRVLRAYVRLMRREDRGEEALHFLEADAAANPDDRYRARRLALVGALSGDASYATEQYEERLNQGEVGIPDKVRFIMALIQAGDADRARAEIATLGDQKVLRPIVAKLNGDIAFKAEDPAGAVAHYQAACRSARVDMLDPAAEAGAITEMEKARLWRAHTRKAIMAAARSRRAAQD